MLLLVVDCGLVLVLDTFFFKKKVKLFFVVARGGLISEFQPNQVFFVRFSVVALHFAVVELGVDHVGVGKFPPFVDVKIEPLGLTLVAHLPRSVLPSLPAASVVLETAVAILPGVLLY